MGEDAIKGFEDEDPVWADAFRLAIHGAGGSTGHDVIKRAQHIANEAVALLEDRRRTRAAAKAKQEGEVRARVAAAVEEVRRTGTYADINGTLYDARRIDRDGALLYRRGHDLSAISANYIIPVLVLVDASRLLDSHSLRAAPERSQRDLLARLRVAAVLAVRFEDVTLVWDSENFDPEILDPAIPDPRILDVEVLGCRPTRATWERLRGAGVPLVECDAVKDEANLVAWLRRRPRRLSDEEATPSESVAAANGPEPAVIFRDGHTHAWVVQGVVLDIVAQGPDERVAIGRFRRMVYEERKLRALSTEMAPVPPAPATWKNLWYLLDNKVTAGPLPVLPSFVRAETT